MFQGTETGPGPSQDALFEELFASAELGGDDINKHFQDAMALLMGQEPELAQQIQRLAQAAGNVGQYLGHDGIAVYWSQTSLQVCRNM